MKRDPKLVANSSFLRKPINFLEWEAAGMPPYRRMSKILDLKPKLLPDDSTGPAGTEPSLREMVLSYYARRSPDAHDMADKYLDEWTRMQSPLFYRSR
jgi:hypothetical protein